MIKAIKKLLGFPSYQMGKLVGGDTPCRRNIATGEVQFLSNIPGIEYKWRTFLKEAWDKYIPIEDDDFEYGICNERQSRRNKKTGIVEFILWKKDEHGYNEDFWAKFGPGHGDNFVKNK